MINTTTYSQAEQDLFVLNQTNYLKNGLFVELGGCHPVNGNNSFILETNYDWDGISIEIDPSYNTLWSEMRKCKFINSDAFTVNYVDEFEKLLKKHNKKEKHFNYLSLDLEPPELTCKLLFTLPLKIYKFDVITYEHDSYRVGTIYKEIANNYLTSLGYVRLKEDIAHQNCIFEDWYVLK